MGTRSLLKGTREGGYYLYFLFELNSLYKVKEAREEGGYMVALLLGWAGWLIISSCSIDLCQGVM